MLTVKKGRAWVVEWESLSRPARQSVFLWQAWEVKNGGLLSALLSQKGTFMMENAHSDRQGKRDHKRNTDEVSQSMMNSQIFSVATNKPSVGFNLHTPFLNKDRYWCCHYQHLNPPMQPRKIWLQLHSGEVLKRRRYPCNGTRFKWQPWVTWTQKGNI